MQLKIELFLTDEDINQGITAAAAVAKVFPAGAPAPALNVNIAGAVTPPGTIGAALPAAEEAAEPAQEEIIAPNNDTAPDVATDSAGVPWHADIHSSNKKFYASGAMTGRWQVRKGVDKAEAEERSQQLAAELKSAQPAPAAEQAAPATGGIPTPENAAPAGAVGEDSTPPPGHGQPANTQQPAAQTAPPAQGGPLPVNWADFLKSLAPAGRTYADIEPFLPTYNMESVSELSPDEQQPIREAIAIQLGLVSQA